MRKNFSRFCLLLGLCLIVLSCTACGFASLATVVDVAIASFGIALTALAKILPANEVSAITGVMTKFQTLWGDVKTAVNNYLSGAATGSLSIVEAALNAIQTYVPDVEAAAGIKNPILQAVIAAILAAATGAFNYIVQNVLPKTSAAMDAYHAGDTAPAHALDVGMKSTAISLRADFEKKIAASGLDAATVKQIHDKMEHETHFHLGGLTL
jgi:hypothetical protein